MATIDPVPLGVSGSVNLPLREYIVRVGREPAASSLLLDDAQRASYVERRLLEALNRPLTNPGSERVAKAVLDYFDGVDVMSHFSAKILESLRDGHRHDRLLISQRTPRLAIAFVAWNGTHLEVQAERVGRYFNALVGPGHILSERGIRLTGLLEIDAYVRDNADPEDAGLALDELFEIDLEYSYVPGFMLKNPDEIGPLPPMVMVNPDLCSAEEKQALAKVMELQTPE